MSDFGVNSGGITNKNLILGKELISSKDKETVLGQAKAHKGSELIFKDNDNVWHANELKEKGLIYGTNDLSVKDQANINLNNEKINKMGAKDVVISFVENDIKSEGDLEKFAADPLTPDVTLREFVENGSALHLVAENPSASADTMRELFKKAPGYGVYIAKNPSTPSDVLEKIYQNEISAKNLNKDEMVKVNLSENNNTPLHILKELVNESNLSIKRGIAGNKNTSHEVLKELYEFKSPAFDNKNDPFIEKALAKNPSSPLKMLNKLADTKNDLMLLVALAENTSLPKYLCQKVYDRNVEISKEQGFGTEPTINEALLKNTNTPKNLIPVLKNELIEHYKKFPPHPDLKMEPGVSYFFPKGSNQVITTKHFQ